MITGKKMSDEEFEEYVKPLEDKYNAIEHFEEDYKRMPRIKAEEWIMKASIGFVNKGESKAYDEAIKDIYFWLNDSHQFTVLKAMELYFEMNKKMNTMRR